jgi:hypothetical protein
VVYASFNAADRLAVINLPSSYGYFYDQFNMKDFRTLFTDSPVQGVIHSVHPAHTICLRARALARQEFR